MEGVAIILVATRTAHMLASHSPTTPQALSQCFLGQHRLSASWHIDCCNPMRLFYEEHGLLDGGLLVPLPHLPFLTFFQMWYGSVAGRYACRQCLPSGAMPGSFTCVRVWRSHKGSGIRRVGLHARIRYEHLQPHPLVAIVVYCTPEAWEHLSSSTGPQKHNVCGCGLHSDSTTHCKRQRIQAKSGASKH